MPWKKGQSGNPNGRAKVDTAAARAAMRETISKSVPAIVKKLVALAKAGDVQAARTLLERVLPVVKSESLSVSLPEVAAAATATQQSELIVKAVAEGRLAPDVGSELLSGLGQAVRINDYASEMEELFRRARELEERKR
ncbi:MAG: DUF5681 domain-containing protein [Pseudomonadota bacterium]